MGLVYHWSIVLRFCFCSSSCLQNFVLSFQFFLSSCSFCLFYFFHSSFCPFSFCCSSLFFDLYPFWFYSFSYYSSSS